jgi:dTDP-4-dehydrorhamnose 3,5-epimerase-like enzyme
MTDESRLSPDLLRATQTISIPKNYFHGKQASSITTTTTTTTTSHYYKV